MVLRLTFKELLTLLDEAKNKTLKDEFYCCVAYDKDNAKFGVYNALFAELEDCNILPLYIFNEDEHERTLNNKTDCSLIIHRELMQSGLKQFAVNNNLCLKFTYNGMILSYEPK